MKTDKRLTQSIWNSRTSFHGSATLRDRYNTYRSCANDGKGIDITTGKPLKTFEEWLNS